MASDGRVATQAAATPAAPAAAIRRLDTRGQPEVLAQIISLEKRMFKKHENWADSLAKEAQKRNTLLLYALLGDSKVVGYIVLTLSRLHAHIPKLAVAADCQMRGIGRALVRAAAAAARERRADSITLHVEADNTAALGLYRSEGFADEAVLEDYYSFGRHAHKMRLELESG